MQLYGVPAYEELFLHDANSLTEAKLGLPTGFETCTPGWKGTLA